MKKYLMTGFAALAICAAFTSCSKSEDLFNPDQVEENAVQQVYNNYNQAFIAAFGQPAANHQWGFIDYSKASTRTESPDANLWGDPNADGGAWNYKVVPPLTDEQKAVVRKYFQTVKNPRYQDPEWEEYFMQQVYKGHTEGQIGENSPEEYQSADKNKIIGSDKMNHLVAVFPDGTLDHINNFNFGTCSTNNTVLNTGASTNSKNPNDWHSDEIMLMQNSTTKAFGYYNSDGSIYRTNYTGLVGFQTIIDELGAEANCLNDGWNRSFMGFDFEQMISGEIQTKVKPTWNDIPGFGSMDWAWDQDEDGNDIFTQIKAPGTESNGWASTPLEGYGYDDPIINDLYYLNSDMNMYCGELSEITDDGVFSIYKDVNENNKNQKCLNLKYIRGLVNSGSYPVSGGSFKKWVKLGGCADGYYSDWIVCLTEAKKQVVPPSDWDIRIIAEDLGCVNDRVRRLLDWCGYPGMKVLTFGFDGDESNPHFPGNYRQNTVAYTGTHDNDTVMGWAESASKQAMDLAMKTLGLKKPEEAPDAFIRYLLKGPCDTVVIPMQDILHLGREARMNYPGTTGGNWLWRMKPDALTLELSMKYSLLNAEANRR